MKIFRFVSLLLLTAIGPLWATESIQGDLFAYENKHTSFTVTIETAKLDRLMVQVVYSTESIPDVGINTAGIDTTNDTIFAPSNNLGEGMPVMLSTAGTTAPSPLITGTTYFVVRVTDNLIKLATTYAQSISRDTIDILTAPAGTWTLRPRALDTGSAGFSWQASNDGTNYIAVTSVGGTVAVGSTQSLVSMGTASLGTRIFDWGEFPYRFLKFIFAGPTNGAIKLRAYLNAKTRS